MDINDRQFDKDVRKRALKAAKLCGYPLSRIIRELKLVDSTTRMAIIRDAKNSAILEKLDYWLMDNQFVDFEKEFPEREEMFLAHEQKKRNEAMMKQPKPPPPSSIIVKDLQDLIDILESPTASNEFKNMKFVAWVEATWKNIDMFSKMLMEEE